MAPPLEAARAVRLLRRIAAGWLGTGHELHLDLLSATMAATLAQTLAPLMESVPERDSWQAQALRQQVGRRPFPAPGGFLEELAGWLDVPPRYHQGHEGPRAYPVLNWMDTVVTELARGRISARQGNEILDAIWDQLANATARLQKEDDALRSTRGVAGCREALAGLQTLETLIGLDRPLDEGESQKLEVGLNRFLAGYDILDEVYLDAAAQELGRIPTPCPQLNYLVLAGRSGEDLQARVYYDLELQLPDFYGGPAHLLQVVARLRAGLDALPHDPVEAGRALGEGHAALLEAAAEAGQVPCPHCGQSNPPTTRVCGHCQATLAWFSAQTAIDAETGGAFKSTFLSQMIHGCDLLQNKLMEPVEFSGLLRSAFQRLQQGRLALGRLPELEGLGFQAQGMRTMLGNAYEQLSGALDCLHEYVVEQKFSALSKGVRTLVAAGRALEMVRDM